jgi:hypothetical protein
VVESVVWLIIACTGWVIGGVAHRVVVIVVVVLSLKAGNTRSSNKQCHNLVVLLQCLLESVFELVVRLVDKAMALRIECLVLKSLKSTMSFRSE